MIIQYGEFRRDLFPPLVSEGKSQSVGIFTGRVEVSAGELQTVKDYCQHLWKGICDTCGVHDFVGHIRFDLVPGIGEDGQLEVKGIYEVNIQGPECAAAANMLCLALNNDHPNHSLLSRAIDPIALLVSQIQAKYGSEQEIAFVTGRNKVKDAWAHDYFSALQQAGLKVIWMTPEIAMQKIPDVVWRWGDARLGDDESHFSGEFVQWLLCRPRDFVFNTMSSEGHACVGNKGVLGDVLETRVALEVAITQEMLLEKDTWVLKPDNGASGNHVYFGRTMEALAWEELLNEKKGKGYSLWKYMPLSKVSAGGMDLAMDFNPAFWVDGDDLTYLYTFIRMDHWKSYERRHTINVAQGAGMTMPTF